MVVGIGIDIVQNKRFSEWTSYNYEKLKTVFTENEIQNSLQAQDKITYFTSRFAAKEAFYKAISQALVSLKFNIHEFSFQFARANIEITKGTWELPEIKVNWQAFEEKLGVKLPTLDVKLSISHEQEFSVAIVIINI